MAGDSQRDSVLGAKLATIAHTMNLYQRRDYVGHKLVYDLTIMTNRCAIV